MWFRPKGARKWCVEDPVDGRRDYYSGNSLRDGPTGVTILVATPCGKFVPTTRFAESQAEPPLVRQRCRECDAYYCQNRRLFTNANGAVLPEKGA